MWRADGQGAARAKYPDVAARPPGGIAGLLELLFRSRGRDDLYHLADDLAFEIDDLLPIVEAASLLGFTVVKEGDIEITPEGREFARSRHSAAQGLFRVAALKHVSLISPDRIRSARQARPLHAEEFFHDLLDEHFSDDEVERQLDTVRNWGRYAELFDRDSAAGRLFHPRRTPTGARHQES